MTTIKFRDWELTVDRELTKTTYDKVIMGGPESCGCGDCRNFANNRESIYPEEIKKLFSEIGIDYKKETEIWHIYRDEDGFHHYSGWFHFKGHCEGKNCAVPSGSNGFYFDLTPTTSNFSIGFHYDNSLSYFDDKEGLVQVEFMVKTPYDNTKTFRNE